MSSGATTTTTSGSAEKAAEEGIIDCPTIEEVLAAEAFYERPMFETGEEYMEALGRGDIWTE